VEKSDAASIKESFKKHFAGMTDKAPSGDRQTAVKKTFRDFTRAERLILPAAELKRIEDELVEEITAFGLLTSFFEDAAVTEIMVNGTNGVYIEQDGLIRKTRQKFKTDNEVARIIETLLSLAGKRVDESSPYADGRLPDGSRVNITIPPVSLDGPVVTIRRFPATPMSLDDLTGKGALTAGEAEQLSAAVTEKRNIVVSGGTGTGKTTFLNALAEHIPDNERLITVEDAAELRLPKPHVVRLQSRPANIEGKGEVTIRDLVRNSLRMRPDRIIVGEVRGGEALDMMQAMNTGHEGSMTTVHANSCADALRRLEVMVLMAGVGLPHQAVGDLLSASLDLIVQLKRGQDGRRFVSEIVSLREKRSF
jgi:pilus assembly protein CpaF